MATKTPSTAKASAPSRSMLIPIVIALVIGLGVGAAALMLLGPKGPKSAEAPKPVLEKTFFVPLDPLTVNLQSEGRPKFLHIGIALKLRDEASKAQVVEYMPELRSRALLLLSNRAPDSLLSTDGKSKLAEEIRVELNRPINEQLPAQGIASVSFNTFVVQ